ncbi:Oxidoreductase [Pleurostoma richardsiae]|uniref:Oxidoreductase n=1 Tax=Pleurostoma richardsiae TaxID=41990 RepID=A0AA38R7F8_9PEZI|nr:Oxidoreductase [Pleurostoma richardsiae]
MGSLRFAVIGAGLIGPRHARTVAANPSTDLVAIVDPLQGGVDLASELKTSYYRTIADLLASKDKPDAAIICTPNHTHVPIAKELSSGGVHVLIEKPFSTDIPSGKELLEHLGTTGVKALVGHHRRFNPYMVTTKEIVSSGKLGKIVAISGIWATFKPLDYFASPGEWRRGKTGGVVLINLIHELDLMHFLFGPITSVHAEKTVSQRGYEAEEGAVLTLRFKSGVVGSFILSDHTPSPHNFESGTGENPLIPKTGQDFYRVFGTEASLSVPDMTVWSYKGTQKSWHQELIRETVPVQEGVPFELQLEHFVRVIHGEEEPSCTSRAGLGALLVCQAVKDALDHNSTVQVDPYEL